MGQRVDVSRESSNWIIESGQAWKLYVTLAGFGLALACFTLAFFTLGAGGGRFQALMVCGFFLACATFVWLITALRCPRCRAKLVWLMAASRPHSSWLIDLAGLDRCLACQAPLAPAEKDRP
jgi:hypothetical protein